MKPAHKIILCLACLLGAGLANPALAQPTADRQERFAARNSLQLTGGYGSLSGLQYDRLLYQSGRHKFFGGLGFGVTTATVSSAPFPYRRSWTFTGTLSFDYSRTFSRRTNHHHLDFGLCFYQLNGKSLVGARSLSSVSGVVVAFSEEVSWIARSEQIFAPRIGYRYQRLRGGFTWRAGVHPFFFSPRPSGAGEGFVFFPTPHASLGWSF